MSGDVAVVMVTVDRSPGVNYLPQTLANLRRSDVFESRWLHSFHLVDSGSADPETFISAASRSAGIRDEHISVHRSPAGRRTANANAAEALRVGSRAGAPWVLFTEDDIDVVDAFLDGVHAWLSRHHRADRRLYSFGVAAAAVQDAYLTGAEAWDYPIDAFWGTQAFAIDREDAADAADTLDELQEVWDSERGYDLQLKLWARARYPWIDEFLATVPSFVQHIGLESAIHPGRFHTFDSWPGPTWRFN